MRVVLLLVLFLLSATGSWAVGIYPVKVDVEARAGTQAKLVFHIVNKSDDAKNATLNPTNLSADSNFVLVFEPARIGTPASWFQPQSESFKLLAKSDTEHIFRVKVPSGTRPGEYFVGLLLDPNESRTLVGKKYKVNLKTRVAAIVKIIVPGMGQLPKSATLGEMTVVIEKKNPIKYEVLFQNTGASSLLARGQCRILDKNGRVYDSFILQAAGMNTKGSAFVFPNGTRRFSGKLQRRLPLGSYIAEFTFDYGNGWRRATAKKEFEVTQEISSEQGKLLVLGVDKELIEEVIPRGGFRAFKATVTNVGFEPIEITVSKTLIAEVSPEKIILSAGGKQDFRIIVKMPKDGEAQLIEQSGKVSFKPRNGEPVSVDVRIKLPTEKSSRKKEMD